MKKTPVGLVQQLALRVAAGASVLSASSAVGIPARTARNLVKTPFYRETLAEAQREASARVVNVMTMVSTKAAARLVKLIDSPDDDIAARAVKIALDTYVPFQTLAQITARMEAIEALDLAQRDPSPTVEG